MRIQHTRFRYWIPPKLTSESGLPGTARIRRLIDFYARLPQGQAPVVTSKNWFERYKATYFDGRGRGQPILYAIAVLILFGYSLDYYFHLRHHKHSIQG